MAKIIISSLFLFTIVLVQLSSCSIIPADPAIVPGNLLSKPELWTKEMQERLNNRSISTRIAGTTNYASSAPFQVALLRAGQLICGGTLIGPTVVLTSAHCVYGYEQKPHSFTVRYNSLQWDYGYKSLQVNKVNRHPLYAPESFDYDVAILILEKAFVVGDKAQSISMSMFEPTSGTVVQMYGWGSSGPSSTVPSYYLKYGNMEIYSKYNCQAIWSDINDITDRMICAYSKSYSMCNSDAGGAVVYNNQLIGIISWGYPCEAYNYPNVFTNVVKLRTWILNNQS